MAATVEGAIQEAMLARAASLVLSPVHIVAWPNVNFTKPSSNRYLEVKFVPNTTTRFLIDSSGPHQRMGFLQINIRDALSQGPRIVDVAGAVAAHFPADLVLSHALGLTVRITAAPEVNDMMVETNPPGVVVPIMIPWECFA
ncbi:MAG: DUF4128 domain-containing protein [Alphaproteobacteria bacterium]|nr:DUF4128 domain-containing protein [Alphaproteobacteria bacterium]